MRLTQTALKEYLKADQAIKRLEARKAEIRVAILETAARVIIDPKEPEFKVGDYTIRVTEHSRAVTIPVKEIRELLGDKAEKLIKVSSSTRVDVKKTGGSIGAMVLTFLAFVVGMGSVGCATPRTKWTDKTMRVMIDPEGVSAKHYVRIQQALMKSGKWVVVDRGMGYNAIKKEQEREHREQTDRFLDSEKFAHWGKLYGVGGVIVAHSSCIIRDGLFKKNFPTCNQYVAIVDTNTGEVIAAAEGQAEGSSYDYDLAPSWDDVVADMEDAYPKNYQPNKDHKILRDYKELSHEEATRQKEELARKIASEKE